MADLTKHSDWPKWLFILDNLFLNARRVVSEGILRTIAPAIFAAGQEDSASLLALQQIKIDLVKKVLERTKNHEREWAKMKAERDKEKSEYESTIYHLEAMTKLLATARDRIKELETALHVRTAELEAQLNPPKGLGWRYLQEPD